MRELELLAVGRLARGEQELFVVVLGQSDVATLHLFLEDVLNQLVELLDAAGHVGRSGVRAALVANAEDGHAAVDEEGAPRGEAVRETFVEEGA